MGFLKKSRIFYAAICLCILSVSILSGCGASKSDAADYVKSLLDARYFFEFEDYARLQNYCPEELEKEQDGKLEAYIWMNAYDRENILDEIYAYTDMLKKIYRLARYEILGAEKVGRGQFVVSVQIEPADFLNRFQKNRPILVQRLVAFGVNPSTATVSKPYLEWCETLIGETTYGDPVTVKVTVTKKTFGRYKLSDSDSIKLDNAIFPP